MEFRVEEKKIVSSEFFRVERARVAWERWNGTMGKTATRYALRRGDSVGILPVMEGSGEVVLVRQFRYPVSGGEQGGFLWEIPAGMVGEKEDHEKAARRELKEEIGIEPRRLDPLISFFLSPGAIDEMIHLFYAPVPKNAELERTGGNPHEEEDLLIGKFGKKRVLSMIANGEIVDAKTIASILFHFSVGK
ncbi:MAG: NUDIX hydrolase [Spirochaetes bacterium]|nr:NUDIX hydrolase [Spirochaetota bacterium]